jgi:hypothetical protein
MTITLEQHYDITWLIAILIIGLIFVVPDLIRGYVVRRRDRLSKNKTDRLLRYSFTKAV